MDSSHKYDKYKNKYLKLKQQLQDGGAKKDTAEKKDKGESFILEVKSISVKQSGEYKYSAVMQRDPAFRVRFHYKTVTKAKVVQSLLRFVNRNLRMKFVKDVTFVMGKNKDKFAGDKIEGDMDLSKGVVIDEVNITMT